MCTLLETVESNKFINWTLKYKCEVSVQLLVLGVDGVNFVA